jgi:hypothetical protein
MPHFEVGAMRAKTKAAKAIQPADETDRARIVDRPESNEWLTDSDVERIFQIRRGTLRYWRSVGKGPPYRRISDRRVIMSRRELEAWLDAGLVMPSDARRSS